MLAINKIYYEWIAYLRDFLGYVIVSESERRFEEGSECFSLGFCGRYAVVAGTLNCEHELVLRGTSMG